MLRWRVTRLQGESNIEMAAGEARMAPQVDGSRHCPVKAKARAIPARRVLFFSAVQFGDPLAGRTRRFAELLMERGYHVAFVEMPSIRASMRRALGGGISTARLPNLSIVRLPPLPGWSRVSETLLGRAWNAMVRRILQGRFGRLVDAVGIVSTPWWMPVLQKLPLRCLVYDFLDHVSVHAGARDLARFERWERTLLQRSDLVTVVSPLLRSFAEETAERERVVHIANGVPSQWLRQPASVAEALLQRVPQSPRVGFLGALFEWIDFDLLTDVARRLTDHHFIIVGPRRFGMPVQELLALPNVHYFGIVPFDEVPQWLHGFDVCLIPFKQGVISDSADPIKLYEYLAAGKPVVSTINFEVPGGPAPLMVAPDAEGFARAIQDAIRLDNPEAQRERKCFAGKHTWDRRIEDFLVAVNGAMERGQRCPGARVSSEMAREAGSCPR